MDGSYYSIHAEEGTILSQSEVSALLENTVDQSASLFSPLDLDTNANIITPNASEDTFIVVSASEVMTTSTPIRPTISADDAPAANDDLLSSLDNLQMPPTAESPPRTSTPKKMYSCTMCRYKTTHSSNLSRHKRIHNGAKLRCDQSSKTYTTQYELNRHKRVSHTTPLICDCCSKQFTSHQGLAAHRKIVRKEFQFFCQVCGRGFQTRKHFNQHSKIKPIECPCGRKFAYKTSLEIHKRQCAQVPGSNHQFPCTICTAIFKTRCALKEHKCAKHSDMTYTCPKCRKSFAWRPSYARHVKKC